MKKNKKKKETIFIVTVYAGWGIRGVSLIQAQTPPTLEDIEGENDKEDWKIEAREITQDELRAGYWVNEALLSFRKRKK